jgi:two-component system OmpR family sensor kinase
MSIRLKISALITTACLLSAFLFSSSVVYEMMEQPVYAIDSELKTVAHEILQEYQKGGADNVRDSRRYWVKIYEQGNITPLYTSYMVDHIQIENNQKRKSFAFIEIPKNLILAEDDIAGKALFRVRKYTFTDKSISNAPTYIVHIGLPVTRKIIDEVFELIVFLLVGLILSGAVSLGISYLIAGYLLKPVKLMNKRTKSITEQNLSKRIPLKEKNTGTDEFNELAITLNNVFDRLENAFNKQKRLIADASHELKTPLSIIKLITDEANMSGKISPEDTKRLSEQTLRMERLIKNILNLSSLEMENAIQHPEKVDLGKILALLVEDYSLIASTKNIDLQADLSEKLIINGDYDKLFRAFSNLLDNAVKYSYKNGTINVNGKRTDNKIEINIFNTGIGIPQSSLTKVFDQFYRVEESRATHLGGSGLGLSIVKRIIELHGGTINISSIEGESATVQVLLDCI